MDEGERLDGITRAVIGAAIDVHKAVGPGLLESVYRACLAYELSERGLKVDMRSHSRWSTRMFDSIAAIGLTLGLTSQ
jgi:hypothetical protein